MAIFWTTLGTEYKKKTGLVVQRYSSDLLAV